MSVAARKTHNSPWRVPTCGAKTDEEVVAMAQGGSEVAMEYLINKYGNFARAKANSYFLVGADKQDTIQEGMIGLCKAIRDFRGDKLSSFRTFAELCITRQIITATKMATRQKHIPLNSYASLYKSICGEASDYTILDVLPDPGVTDPQEMIVNREEYDTIRMKMSQFLSDLERKVLAYYLEGKSYREIALRLNRHAKVVDNALQRIKRKSERYLGVRKD